MDTIENTVEPVGSDGATSSPDTSAQVDTQPVDGAEVSSADGTQETGAVETPLLAGKYKSQEDLEKAYKDLEGKLGSLGQKAAVVELIQEKYGMSPDQIREALEREELARMEREYAENPAGYALREVQELKNQLALKEEESKLNSFISQNPEYAPFKDDIMEFGFLPKYREMSYEDIAREKFGNAIATGQQLAYKKIEVKKNTQASGVTSAPKRQFGEEDLKNLSVAELEAILPHADTSQRLY